MTILLNNITGNRDAWLKEKEKRIGSSEIATIAGLNPFCSPLELWAKKTGKVKSNSEPNARMVLGTLFEDDVAEYFTHVTGIKTQHVNKLYQHDKFDFAIASPDYVTVEDAPALLEIKTTGYQGDWTETTCPDYVLCQLQWQLGITGYEHGYAVGLVGGNPDKFFYPHFEFNADVFEQLLELAKEFMRAVETETPPEAGPNDGKLLQQLFNKPVKDKPLKTDSQALYKLCQQYEKEKAELKAQQEKLKPLQTAVKETENKIKQMIAGHDTVEVFNYKINYSQTTVPEAVRKAYVRESFKLTNLTE
ncbi:hypothetical protein D6827_03445 [Candidatus Parcubacteria bacterium]|nr:MAG: hypothetical protein D6827_03445 [Candidatus Parcubacteria bacterium]